MLETGRKGNSCYGAKVHICLKALARKPLEKSRLIHVVQPPQMTSDSITPVFLQQPVPTGTTVPGLHGIFLHPLKTHHCAALKWP